MRGVNGKEVEGEDEYKKEGDEGEECLEVRGKEGVKEGKSERGNVQNRGERGEMERPQGTEKGKRMLVRGKDESLGQLVMRGMDEGNTRK